MATKVIIMRGPSGSGKSTYVREKLKIHLHDQAYGEGSATRGDYGVVSAAYVVSSDSFFLRRQADGSWKHVFDPKQLGEAHGRTLRKFISVLGLDGGGAYGTVVVDNTNTTIAEIAPYVAIAEAYGASVEIHCLPYDRMGRYDLAARNKHGVPASTIFKQIVRLLESGKTLQESFPRARIVFP